MKLKTNLALVLATWVVAGCKSWSPSPYISPRVEGRVLDADTRQPLAEVKVTRVQETARLDTGEPPRGAQALQRNRTIRTDRAGRFVVDSERDLVLLRRVTWYSVTLAFERGGYDRLQKTYTLANLSTNSPSGKPLIKTGDILLQPASP